MNESRTKPLHIVLGIAGVVIAAVLLCSCTAASPEETAAETEERNFVDIRRKDGWYELECYGPDYSQIENVLAETAQILMVRADTVDDILYTGSYHFEYGCEILKIYYDGTASLKEGDRISVFTTEGIMKAGDAAALIRYPMTYHGEKTLTETYGENDYISSSQWNAVPIEVGGTYIVYLSPEPLETYGYYDEVGYGNLYEVSGEDIRTGSERVLSEMTLSDVEGKIAEQIRFMNGQTG